MVSRFRVTPRRLLRLAGEAVLLLALLLAVERFLSRDAVRGPAPALQAMLTDGRVADLAAYRGRAHVVYFWATWCPVCSAQRAAVDGLLSEGRGLSVAMRSAAELSAYLAGEALAWPVVDDADGRIAAAWGVSGVPAVFVLDARGQVRFVTRGYTTAPGLRARLWLAERL
jgi:peroxiredoxin